jgi:type IV secretory pathway VirJ component
MTSHPAWTRALTLLACLVLFARCSGGAFESSEQLSHGRFEQLRIYHPPGTAQRLALVLSGDGGWSSALGALAERLTSTGTLVAGIDSRALLRSLAHDPASCISPGADLVDLARWLRERYHLASTAPVLLGHSAGATLVFIALAQAPPGSFAGGLTLSFCEDFDLSKPLCPAPAFEYRPRSGGVRLLPAGRLPAPWIALHAVEDTECPAADARDFVAGIPGARFVAVAGVTHSYHHMSRWWGQLESAYRELAALPPPVEPSAPEPRVADPHDRPEPPPHGAP